MTCSNYIYIDKQSNNICVPNCSNILLAVNPPTTPDYCKCPNNAPYIDVDILNHIYCTPTCNLYSRFDNTDKNCL